MTLWYGISGEWIFLLNPALWLFWMHPAILFFVLRRKVPLGLTILLICVLSPFLTWILSLTEFSCIESIAEHLADSGTAEYVRYLHPSGPAMTLLVLFGWVPSIILVPFWLIVLLFSSLVLKGIRLLTDHSGKPANDRIELVQ